MSFQQQLQAGKIGESRIAEWFKRRGYSILPVYELEVDTGKGPRLFTPDRQVIAPDMLVFSGEKCFWIEAKHKEAFSWYRIGNYWETGIDFRHYEDYLRVSDYSPWPVWLFFLHEGGQAKDSPPNSPRGLFGNTLEYLKDHESHRWPPSAPHKMVYWARGDLMQIDKPEDTPYLFRKTIAPPVFSDYVTGQVSR